MWSKPKNRLANFRKLINGRRRFKNECECEIKIEKDAGHGSPVAPKAANSQNHMISSNCYSKTDKTSIYVHWPYCSEICSYCSFNKYKNLNVNMEAITSSMVTETESLLKLSGVKSVSSIYFGGGTPSLADVQTLDKILTSIKKSVCVAQDAEINLEVNPTALETTKLREFKDIGINRISIGVQALNKKDLKFLNREHTVEDAVKCVLKAKDIFPGKVNVDLIFGRPYQTIQNLERELQQMLELCDNHLSLYQLMIEPGTALFKLAKAGKLDMPEDEMKGILYERAVEMLRNAGFKRYEVSNFARNGSESEHNKAYWEGHQYVGVGPGAHGRFVPVGSILREARVQIPEPNRWMSEVKLKGHGTAKAVPQTKREQLEELLILSMRGVDGLSEEMWQRKCTDVSVQSMFRDSQVIEHLIELGFIELDEIGVRATDRGFPVLDAVVTDMLVAIEPVLQNIARISNKTESVT